MCRYTYTHRLFIHSTPCSNFDIEWYISPSYLKAFLWCRTFISFFKQWCRWDRISTLHHIDTLFPKASFHVIIFLFGKKKNIIEIISRQKWFQFNWWILTLRYSCLKFFLHTELDFLFKYKPIRRQLEFLNLTIINNSFSGVYVLSLSISTLSIITALKKKFHEDKR